MELVAHAWIDVPFEIGDGETAVEAIQRNAQEVLEELFTEKARPAVQMRYGTVGDGFPYGSAEEKHAEPEIHPSYYEADGMQLKDFMRAFMTEEEYQGFLKGCAIKYLVRERSKNGSNDLSKCAEYVGWLKEEAERDGR